MIYDPMLDYTVDKLKNGIKALDHINKHSVYDFYAPIIAASIASDIKEYQDYLESLKRGIK